MKQYIDKAAVVAEIERRLEALANTSAGDNREFAAIIGAQQYKLIKLAQYINTLEVKEIDSIDSFIEKACKGIEHLLSGYIIRNFHFGDSYEMDTLIDDFKNYMKGE